MPSPANLVLYFQQIQSNSPLSLCSNPVCFASNLDPEKVPLFVLYSSFKIGVTSAAQLDLGSPWGYFLGEGPACLHVFTPYYVDSLSKYVRRSSGCSC